jgi:hypothetical protein
MSLRADWAPVRRHPASLQITKPQGTIQNVAALLLQMGRKEESAKVQARADQIIKKVSNKRLHSTKTQHLIS